MTSHAPPDQPPEIQPGNHGPMSRRRLPAVLPASLHATATATSQSGFPALKLGSYRAQSHASDINCDSSENVLQPVSYHPASPRAQSMADARPWSAQDAEDDL